MTIRVAVHAGQLIQPFPGGIGRYVRKLLGALPDADVSPVPFAAGPPPEPIPDWVNLGFPHGRWRYEAWHRLRRPVLDVGPDVEVVHATSLAIPPPGKRPLVVTVHDLIFLDHPECLTPRGVAFHRRGLKIACDEASAFIVPSAWVAQRLEVCGVEASRIHVAHHGVDTFPDNSVRGSADRSPCANNTTRFTSLRLAKHCLYPMEPHLSAGALNSVKNESINLPDSFILFVGTIEPRKGINDLLVALDQSRRKHPELNLVIAGPAGWGEPPDFSAPHVHWLGAVEDSTLDHLYRNALGLVLPSRDEGFGLPLLEAMARGCPVISSDAACLPEVVGDAGVLVPLGDIEAISNAINNLTDTSQHRLLVERGLARAATFTWQASAKAHAGAYRAALTRQ
ncbi:MAG: glycosyltransferase family 4 protein [Acidimicrobiales bacterium]